MKPTSYTTELKDFAAQLPPTGRLMGLDLGTKTIGVAISDAGRQIATAQHTVQRSKLTHDLDALDVLREERPVVGIVLGYPLNMDGTSGPRAQATRAFARELKDRLDCPILLWDERLSTAAIQRMMIDEIDMNRKRRSEMVDQLAASYILQGALDALSHG
jgi:putative Holliday junction resolvase